MSIRILQGDCRDVLRGMADASVHCCVTSPPYLGLRDYGVAGQIGLETTPESYISELIAVFREVQRVLRDDGTCWLNLGDSYAGGGRGGGSENSKQRTNVGSLITPSKLPHGVKPKDLLMIPAQVALALRNDGWFLRSHIIWHKPNPMPESVTDRPTSAHESIFLLTKRARYYYDADAVRESATSNIEDGRRGDGGSYAFKPTAPVTHMGVSADSKRNLRNVWTIATQPFSEAHFATFPPDLIEPCIKAGTSEKGCCAKCGAPWVRDVETVGEWRAQHDREAKHNGEHYRTNPGGGIAGKNVQRERINKGWSRGCLCAGFENVVPCTVLDPFGGAGTTGMVADRLQRNAILIELNPEYADMARHRLTVDAGFFNTGVEVEGAA